MSVYVHTGKHSTNVLSLQDHCARGMLHSTGMDSPFRANLARNVKRMRLEHDWSQAELAKRTGIAQTAISYIERLDTKSPTLETIEALAHAFRVPCWAMILDLSSMKEADLLALSTIMDCFMETTQEESRLQIARTAAREAEYCRLTRK